MTIKSEQLTPMMRQFNAMKAQYPDHLLLFRCGDFYETFGEDARRAAELLNITLTKRVGAEALHWMERHKVAFKVLFLAAVGAVIWSVVGIVRGLVGGA